VHNIIIIIIIIILQLPDCWLEVSIRKVLRPATSKATLQGLTQNTKHQWYSVGGLNILSAVGIVSEEVCIRMGC
jgi:hypothetical protein